MAGQFAPACSVSGVGVLVAGELHSGDGPTGIVLLFMVGPFCGTALSWIVTLPYSLSLATPVFRYIHPSLQ
jgi:hypothetical protein